MNTILAKAVAFGEAMQPSFKDYARQILKNAKVLADELMKQGFKLVTNGTDNHLIMINMPASYKIDGRQAQDLFEKVGLAANCNAIPNDSLPPYRPSGLRLGTPAITTRGLKEKDMAQIALWMVSAVKARTDDKTLKQLHSEVREFALGFPLPSDK
jgi:glycine hydroxymethyltransferase